MSQCLKTRAYLSYLAPWLLIWCCSGAAFCILFLFDVCVHVCVFVLYCGWFGGVGSCWTMPGATAVSFPFFFYVFFNCLYLPPGWDYSHMIVTVCRSNNNISDGDAATVKQSCSWRQQPTLPATQWRSQQGRKRKETKQIKLLSVFSRLAFF